MDKNFATLNMTREELSERFNYNISNDLFNYMKRIDCGEKGLIEAAEAGFGEPIDVLERIELSVEDAWRQAIEEEKRKEDHEMLLSKTGDNMIVEEKIKKKGIGTLGKTRHELIDYFEKYIEPDLFDIFLDYNDEDERAKHEAECGKMSDAKWEEDRDFILENAWEKALDEWEDS